MRSQNLKRIALALFILIAALNSLAAQELPATGIGLRGIHWNVKQTAQHVSVSTSKFGTDINVGGFGGAIFVYSRVSRQILLEFSLSGIGIVENNVSYTNGVDLNSGSITPFLLGMRYLLIPVNRPHVLNPYIEGGIGVYVVNDVRIEEKYFARETVSVASDTRPGGYAGAGVDFNLSRNFALNFNLRYHFVDFEKYAYKNGIEIGFGFSVMWGEF